MNPTSTSTFGGRLVVLLLIFGVSAAAVATESVSAQVPVYKIEGVVYGPNYQPLEGAAVTVFTMAGTSAGTATSDASGKYSVGNLEAATYNVSAVHACCDKEFIPVVVSGTDPVVQQNFRLRAPAGATGEGPAHVLKGIVKDEKSAKPIEGVHIEVYNYYYDSPEGDDYGYIRPSGGQQTFTTTSAADGSYSLSLRPGSVNLNAYKDAYDRLSASFEIREDRTLDLPMRTSQAQSVLIKGVVKSEDGSPIRGASVSVQPDYSCRGDVCTSYAEPSGGSSQQGDVYFYYEPRNGPYNNTQTDEDGRYAMHTSAGALMVYVWAENHIQDQESIDAKAGETKEVNFSLKRIPPDSVKVSGRVVDAQSGDGVPHAEVQLENQEWGHYNYTRADDSGHYEFWTKPGYVIITASAYRYYYIPCEYPSSTSEPDGEGGNGSGMKPMPACEDGGQRERKVEYFPRVHTAQGTADEPMPIDFKLEPRPAPAATFIGYVVNQTSKKGVEGATISFYNERTHDYGQAITDAEGSYRITVHGGYYTVRAYAQGFFDAVVNDDIGDTEEKRLDLFVTPGERKYGYCCYHGYGYGGDVAYASGPKAAGGGMGAPAPAMPEGGYAGGSSSAQASDDAGAEQSYVGSGGGLGPYRPASGDGGSSPSVGVLMLLAAFLGIVAQRRGREKA